MAASEETKGKILIVCTNSTQQWAGKGGGAYLEEFAVAYDVFTKAGYSVDFASPAGGKISVDGDSITAADEVSIEFWNDKNNKEILEQSESVGSCAPADYLAIWFAGGFSALDDFGNEEIGGVVSKWYAAENVKAVAAVCHGVAAFIHAVDEEGKALVEGKGVTGFTNAEEEQMGMKDAVPYLVETGLIEKGAVFTKTDPWGDHTVQVGKLVSGQNPASTGSGAAKVVALIEA